MNITDWIDHGNILCRSQVRAIKKDMVRRIYTEDEIQATHREMKIRDFCWQNRERAEQFDGSPRIWWWYMTEHAKLQVKRYANEITEAEFRNRCRKLREHRDSQDQWGRKMPWLKPEKRVV